MIVQNKVLELEALINESKRLPLTNKVAIDKDEALVLIDEIKNAIPSEFKEAQWITTKRKDIAIDAKLEGDNIIAEAKVEAAQILEEAKQKVTQEEVYKVAQEYADRLIESSKKEAQLIKEGSRKYAFSVLESAQESINKYFDILEENKKELGKNETETEE